MKEEEEINAFNIDLISKHVLETLIKSHVNQDKKSKTKHQNKNLNTLVNYFQDIPIFVLH